MAENVERQDELQRDEKSMPSLQCPEVSDYVTIELKKSTNQYRIAIKRDGKNKKVKYGTSKK